MLSREQKKKESILASETNANQRDPPGWFQAGLRWM